VQALLMSECVCGLAKGVKFIKEKKNPHKYRMLKTNFWKSEMVLAV